MAKAKQKKRKRVLSNEINSGKRSRVNEVSQQTVTDTIDFVASQGDQENEDTTNTSSMDESEHEHFRIDVIVKLQAEVPNLTTKMAFVLSYLDIGDNTDK